MYFGVTHTLPPAAGAIDTLRLVEKYEFDQLWVTDSHVLWYECYSVLGWLAAQVADTRVALGTNVTNPKSRDPIVVASAFGTLNELYEGPLVCGIGRGDSAVRVVHGRPATTDELEAGINSIRRLGRGESTVVEDTTVQFEWSNGQFPVFLAAYGPRTLELAGRVADGLIMEVADPFFVAWAVEHFHRGAVSAGRDPSELRIVCSTASCVAEDRQYAREVVRPIGAIIGNHIAETLRNRGPNSMPPDYERLIEARGGYDYGRHALRSEQAAYVPDEILDRVCIIGDAGHCATRVNELRELGVTDICFYSLEAEIEPTMRAYAEEVIPHFRGA